jgi:hypothetical protein
MSVRLSLVALALLAVPGCALPAVYDVSCTEEDRAYNITLNRTLDVASANVAGIQACIDDVCTDVPAAGADGHVKFGGFPSAGKGELALSIAPDGRLVVSATFNVGERRGSARLRVIVLDSRGITHTAEGTVMFDNGTCHNAPLETDV